MVGDTGDALCMRVQSDRPQKLRGGEVGYVHYADDRRKALFKQQWRPPKKSNVKPLEVDASRLFYDRLAATHKDQVKILAEMLGVAEHSLVTGTGIGAAWFPEYSAWGFPMKDGCYKTVGVRLRNDVGDKWAVRGTHAGLFYAESDPQSRVVICEGPTDTAAALSCGLFAIGRPSCSGGSDEIVKFINVYDKTIKEVVIIADNDEPGIKGAKSLQDALPISSCIVVLPCKDMRQFYKMGGNSAMLEVMTMDVIWTRRERRRYRTATSS